MLCLSQYIQSKRKPEQTQVNKQQATTVEPTFFSFRREDLLNLNRQILGLNDKELSQFYLKSKFDVNLAIKQDEFVEQFPFFKQSSVVSWVPLIVSGFN
jgi:hypothetical protein